MSANLKMKKQESRMKIDQNLLGRLTVSLTSIYVNPKRDVAIEFDLEGEKKSCNVDKSDEELDDTQIWVREKPIHDDSVLIIKVFTREKIGKNKLLGESVFPLRYVSKELSQDAKIALKEISGKTSEHHLCLRLEYVRPALDPDEVDVHDAKEPDMDQTPIKKEKKGHAISRKIGFDRSSLSSKTQDFQIRVYVHEGRNLSGGNLHPVCNVTIGKQSKHTRVQRSTAKPQWEEVLIFDFNISPLELCDLPIVIEVLNSKKLRSDCLVGSFKFELGTVYEHSEHALWHKWILLTDPLDKESGAKGYTRLSFHIIGPRDKIKNPPKISAVDDHIDIESNILRPAGIQLQPTTFTIKVYQAEDIPEMDTDYFVTMKRALGMHHENLDKVDPYVIVSFAGIKRKTRVVYNSYTPEWNQELNIGVQVPSMCEQLMLRLMDKDHLNKDDTVATHFLHLTRLSSADPDEEGFLPTFGPAYINFYGSPREFTTVNLDLDQLNKGLGEGCAYRGRMLMELTVKTGRYPTKDEYVTDISNDDLYAVQQFLRRRKYRLFVGFLEATMLNPVDGPIEFEVSIGEYGNKFSVPTSAITSPSTTQPCSALYDGQHYYYLPWGVSKPCIMILSQWEDMMYRIEMLNHVEKIIDRLNGNIRSIKHLIRAEAPIEESAKMLMSLLDALISDLEEPLKQLPTKGYTHLDKKMYNLRDDDIKTIMEDARELRENAVDLDMTIADIENFRDRLLTLAVEPQNSIPDLIVWMFVGGKREAYLRIPSHHLMYSTVPNYCGKYCGKISTFFLRKPMRPEEINQKRNWQLPGKLQLFTWMGLDDTSKNSQHRPYGGEISVFAETYENQIYIGSWTTKPMPRPKWSDATGRLKLPKDAFRTPTSWLWDDDWFIQPTLSSFEVDSGLTTFQDDVFENHLRVPGTLWETADVYWTDVANEESLPKNEIMCPMGWQWSDIWTVDLSRAVDEEGYEYCLDQNLGGYVPVEKTYHLCRRRRWVRNRKRLPNQREQLQEERQKKAAEEGWEYARLFTSKFHPKKQKMDMVRRRLWLRKMVTTNPESDPTFTFMLDDITGSKENIDSDYQKSDMIPRVYSPRMYITFKEVHNYQLRAYLYQARDLFSADTSGLSDPYTRVVFGHQSMSTKIIKETLCPTWDQTIIMDRLELYGDPEQIAEQPAQVVLEVFDYDPVGHDFLGRCVVTPVVNLTKDTHLSAKLNWYPIIRGGEHGGELLATIELYMADEDSELPPMPPMKGDVYQVANGIRPMMQLTRIEVLTWGVRHMKKFQLASINNPSVEIECGGEMRSTPKIKNAKKNPNFETTSLFFDVYLPVEELYMPPLNIRLLDHRAFGVKPLVGTHTMKTMQKYRRDPVAHLQALREKIIEQGFAEHDSDCEIEVDNSPMTTEEGVGYKSIITSASKSLKDGTSKIGAGSLYSWFSHDDTEATSEGSKSSWDISQVEEVDSLIDDVDWWSKYYASIGDINLGRVYMEKGYDTMEIFDEELENFFNNFKDLADSYPIYHGKTQEDELIEDKALGFFKGSFRIYPLPADGSDPPPKMLENVPDNCMVDLKVRVYIIRAKGLQPQDPNGLSDPYPALKLGKHKIKDRDNYIPKCLEPMFGKLYEMDCTIPLESELKVQIFDYDVLSGDDLIGETKLDLEDRYLSPRRGLCGLPKRYYVSGPFKWRDCEKPKEILEKWCSTQRLPSPAWFGNSKVKVAGQSYSLKLYEIRGRTHKDWGPAEERLSLYVLLDLKLVPEHIETRTLYNPLRPDIPQGTIEMFVDIFPRSRQIPPPINITPRAPQELELRVIVWNTYDVIMSDVSITGEEMSDIYVKGWLKGHDKKQKTDIHYRSLDGEGNFNWRFLFPFEYLPAEEVIVIKKKEHFFSLDKHEEKYPVVLCIQIWDNDIFSPDEFLGVIELNLNRMPKPSKYAKTCSLDDLPDNDKGKPVPLVSLFEQKNVKGFWPCYLDLDPETPRALTGKVELELEILTKEDAETKPAGKGREDPNDNPHLKDPDRPATSFSWFTSPWKTLKFIIWKNYKWYIIGGLLIILTILLIGLFIYSTPGVLSEKLFNAL